MKLIVGLGNPGMEYAFTPHNAGFLAIDRIAQRAGVAVVNRRGRALTGRAVLAGESCLLAKPETFMNRSGESVRALLDELELDTGDLLVLYDELAFALGEFRIRGDGSSNGHNGARSINASLGTEAWARVRIGVGRPLPAAAGPAARSGGSDYLLAPMKKADLAVLDAVLDRVADAVETVVSQGIATAMNRFNRRDTAG